MSMLGIAFLGEIVVKADTQLDAGYILNQLRKHVITSLRQTGQEGEAKDGMDIAMSVVNLKSLKLQFAGAYNPLYLIRKTEEQAPDNYELTQIKADKMPIGIHFRKDKQFTNQEVELQRGDTLYMFSDGYVDQFGGEQGKKFMTKRFKRLLLSIQDKNMEEQKIILEQSLSDWMSHYSEQGIPYEQIDDILVMGIKI